MKRWLHTFFFLTVCATLAANDARATRIDAGVPFSIRRSDVSRDGQHYKESIEMLFDANYCNVLSLLTTMGSVRVRTWSQDLVRVVVDKMAAVDTESDALRVFEMFRVQALKGESDLKFTAEARTRECAKAVGVTFTVWVPKRCNVDIRTESGNIDIPRMDGKFAAHTADGTISIDCEPEGVDIEVDNRTGDEGVAPATPREER